MEQNPLLVNSKAAFFRICISGSGDWRSNGGNVFKFSPELWTPSEKFGTGMS